MDRAAALIGLLVLLRTAVAGGHEETYPKCDRLELQPDGVRVVLEYAVPAGEEARMLRQIFDRDRSGALDAGEQVALLTHLQRLASHFVSLSVDGRPLPLRQVDGGSLVAGAGMERLAVAVTLWAPVLLSEGTHVLLLADRHKDRRLGVPVRVTLQGLRLLQRLLPQPFLFADRPLEVRVGPAG